MQIRTEVIDAIVAHARADAPDECCGLLVGSEGCIVESVPTRNLEASPTRFRVDPAGHFALIRRLRSTSARIAGAYHSHPHSGVEPSASDVAEAHDPDYLYLMVSLADPANPVIAGYRIAGGNFDTVPLVRVP